MLTYNSKICFLEYCFSKSNATKISATFLISAGVSVSIKYKLLATCWVIVLPPSKSLKLETFLTMALPIAIKSIAPCFQSDDLQQQLQHFYNNLVNYL